MRASVIAALLMIGLLAVGLRLHAERGCFVTDVAYAQEAPPQAVKPPEAPKMPAPAERKGGTATLSRSQQTPPVWKAEVVGDDETSAEAARKNALKKAADELSKYLTERFPDYRYQ